MATQLDHESGFDADSKSKSTTDSSQLNKIAHMLQNHDENGKIACQVNQCLIDDGITLELLTNFDEKSMEKTVYSWKLDTFKEKPFIICGLLVNGIKHLKLKSNNNNTSQRTSKDDNQKNDAITQGNTNANLSNAQININAIVSQEELDMMSKLTQFETIITSKIDSFENDAKERENTKTKSKNEYQTQTVVS